MAQKFIITRRGILRMGHVAMHKDLLHPGDSCMGGGLWQFDPVASRLLLSGRSYDFGPPMWAFFLSSGVTLKVPRDYRGLAIAYRPDEPGEPELRVSEEMAVEYI